MELTSLKYARLRLGKPQVVIAQRADMHPSRLSRAENGHRPLSADELQRVAIALGVTLEALQAAPPEVRP